MSNKIIAILLLALSLFASAQAADTPAQKEAELVAALQRVIKTPVILKNFSNTYEAFCQVESEPTYDSVKRLRDACDFFISGEKTSEIDRAAAQLLLGIGMSNYSDNQFPGQPCRDAFEFLQPAAEYIEKHAIPVNEGHERIAYCLVFLDRNEQALKWLERSARLNKSVYTMLLSGVAYENLKNFAAAKKQYESVLAQEPGNEDAKKRLAGLDKAISDNAREQAEYKKRLEEINTPACNNWRAAIKKNRASCDKLLRSSLDAFYSCMDLGMTRSGYAKRADANTQQLYQQCGVGSWTDSNLAP